MLTIQRIKTISKLAFPVGVALSSTLVMSLIDLAMVGRLGNSAIAAVGLSAFSFALVLALVTGIEPAVQGLVARSRGECSTEPGCLPLACGLLSALIVGIPLTVICYLSTPFYFSLISSDPAVTRIGVPFLRTLYLSNIAVGMIVAFKGYWAGMEKPSVFMCVALSMDCLNIIVNYVLIFGHFGAPALGATGAAIGTVSSLCVGVLVHFAIIHYRFRSGGFFNLRPGLSLLVRIFKLGLPATMQNLFYSAGYVVFLWLVGQVGTVELAAAAVLVRIAEVLLFMAMSLGSASATLVSKAIGENDLAAAAQWGWDSGKLGVIAISVLGSPLVLFPRMFLSLFLSDPHTIAISVIPLRLVGATAGVGSLLWIFTYTLFSVGDGKRVALLAFTMQCIFLPIVWAVGPYSHHGLLQIWLVQMAYGALATVITTAIWADGGWKKITI